MKRIYISGKITGEPENKVKAKFTTATERIKSLEPNVVVVNPLQFCRWDWSWEKCMKECLGELLQCDALYLLPDWKDSKGAKLELLLARQLKKEIIIDSCEVSDCPYHDCVFDVCRHKEKWTANGNLGDMSCEAFEKNWIFD
jgi:hypothetical protein